jgi:hypothetical protein
MNPSGDVANRLAIREQVVALLEKEKKEPLVVIGWTLQQQYHRPGGVYKFRVVTNENFEWTFFVTQSRSNPTVRVELDGVTTETIVTDVDHFKKIVQGVNEQVYGAKKFTDAKLALSRVKTVFDGSLLKNFYFNAGIAYSENKDALEIDVIRVNDVSTIKIGFEKKTVISQHGNEISQSFFYVTFTTVVEAESGESVFLPPKKEYGLKDVVTALQTAVRMRLDFLYVPDQPREKRKDPLMDSRRYDPGDMSVSAFTEAQLMSIMHKGCDGFSDYFIRQGESYTTRQMMQPYVFITMAPDVRAQKIKVAYESGVGVSASERIGVVASERKEELWSHTDAVAKQAMTLLKNLVREYINTPQMAKSCLESILVYREGNLKYKPLDKKTGFKITITGDFTEIKTQYKRTNAEPIFIFIRKFPGGEEETIQCHHPSHVARSIDAVILEAKDTVTKLLTERRGR